MESETLLLEISSVPLCVLGGGRGSRRFFVPFVIVVQAVRLSPCAELHVPLRLNPMAASSVTGIR